MEKYRKYIDSLDHSLDHLAYPKMSIAQYKRIYIDIDDKDLYDLIAINHQWSIKSSINSDKSKIKDARKVFKSYLHDKYEVDNEKFRTRKQNSYDKLNIHATMNRYPCLTLKEATEMQKVNLQLRDKSLDEDEKDKLIEQREHFRELDVERQLKFSCLKVAELNKLLKIIAKLQDKSLTKDIKNELLEQKKYYVKLNESRSSEV